MVGGVTTPVFAQSAVEPDLSGFRTFATWPDDAQVSTPGQVIVSVSLSSWRWAFGRGTGFPAIFAGVGVAPRLQISAAFERDGSTYSDGTTQTAFGDSYIVAKLALVDADTHRVGLAISPLLHALGNDSLTYYRYYKSSDMGRVQWALPMHVQVPFGPVRLSGSAGYFSVGSSFVSGTVEASLNSRVVVNGTVSESFSSDTSAFGDAAGAVSRRRSDVTGGAWLIVSPSAFVFGTVGRTISAADQNSMTLSANVGIALLLGKR